MAGRRKISAHATCSVMSRSMVVIALDAGNHGSNPCDLPTAEVAQLVER